MAKIYGGRKHDWPNKKAYKAHLREMVKQGKSNNAEGAWNTGSGTAWLHMLHGYRLS